MYRLVARSSLTALCLCLAACGGEEELQDPDTNNSVNNNNASTNNNNNSANNNNNNEPPPPAGVPVLGSYSHDISKVAFEWMSDGSDPMAMPRDLAVNPDDPSQVWVVNKGDNSITVFTQMGTETQVSTRYNSFGSDHFLSKPVAIAWGANGTFATIQEEDDFTQGPPPRGTPADFMGPTLWPSLLSVFDAGHGSHLDMLHNSPNGMGIAHEKDNVYWVFDGYHSSITRYDFNQDHGYGGSDHSDGTIYRYAEGQVARVEDVPSHMEFDARTNLLYIADTGNNRIAVLNTMSGERAGRLWPNYDGVDQWNMNGAEITTLVDGDTIGMQQPSGLAMDGDVIYIADPATSTVYAFDLEGELLDHLVVPVAQGGLAGIEMDPAGSLWGIDKVTERVFRISPLAE